MVTAQELHGLMEGGEEPQLLDVRFSHEWKAGHLPGALAVELGSLPEHVDSLPRDISYATICAAGFRAATAASVLEREGFEEVVLVEGGTGKWSEAGYPLEKGE